MAAKKLKSNRAAMKRYRVTGSGAVKVGRKGKRHNFSSKSRKWKRQARGTMLLEVVDAARVVRMMPYSF